MQHANRPHARTQLFWAVWKNMLLKRRNIRNTFKEIAFPVYTFALVAMLKAAIELDAGDDLPREYISETIPSLDRTQAGLLCRGLYDDRRSPSGGGSSGGGGNANDMPPCLLLMSPDTDPIVAQIAARVGSGLKSVPSVGVMTLGNMTAAKRYNLDHPGQVLAALDVSLSSGCRGEGGLPAAPCEVRYDILVNATSMMMVKAGFNIKGEQEAGFFTIQEIMHRSISSVVPTAMGRPLSGSQLLDVRVKPMPTIGGDGLSMAQAKTKLSLVTSLYFVLAWIPTVQILLVNIVTEKQLGLKESMRCMGLKDMVFWVAWLVSEMASTSAAILLVIMMGSYTGLFRDCDVTLVFVIFILFVASLVTMSFAISSFFVKPKVAAAAGSAVVAVFSFIFTLLRVTGSTQSAFWPLSFLSPVAMSSIGAQIWHGGVTWASATHGSRPIISVMLVMLMDTVIYLMLAIYLEGANRGAGWDLLWCMPRGYRPWRRRCSLDDDIPLLEMPVGTGRGSQGGDNSDDFGTEGIYESEGGACKEATVRLRGLRKVYDEVNGGGGGAGGTGVVAVDGVSADLHAGQVFVLLGPNGAGKSTLIGMLTGTCLPTSGLVSVGGLRVDDPVDLERVREDLGYCPQSDVLLDELTPREHLTLFAGLRGLDVKVSWGFVVAQGGEGCLEIEEVLDKFGLREHEQVPVRQLSGGLKRRLSVAISLLGSPSLVVLDEPSSGMDARGRRSLWDAIIASRAGRVVVVSTHSMEEADAIADRIGILVNGTLKVTGEPLELKTRYGLGYKVHCEMEQSWASSQVSANPSPFPRSSEIKHASKRLAAWMCDKGGIRDATVEVIGHEVIISLGQADVGLFPKLFTALDEDMTSLGISAYGLTSTSLEEVFLHICDGVFDQGAPGHGELPRASLEGVLLPEPLASEEKVGRLMSTPKTPKLLGRHLNGWRATMALCWKLAAIRWRDRRAAAHFVFYPTMVIILAFTVFGNHYFTFGAPDILSGGIPFSLGPWGGGKAILVTNETGSPLPTILSQFFVGKAGMENLASEVAFTSWGSGGGAATLTYNSSSTMAGSCSLNALYNSALASGRIGDSAPISVVVSVDALPGRSATNHPQSYVLAFLLSMAFLYAPTYVAEDIVSERERRLKHILHVLGARGIDYWWSHLVADAMIFLAPMIVALIAGAMAASPAFLPPYSLSTLLVMFIYCFAMPAMIYPITLLFQTSKSVLKWLGTVLLLTTTIPLTVMFTASVSVPFLADPLGLVLSVFPALAFAYGIFKIAVAALISRDLERGPGGPFEALEETGVISQLAIMVVSSICYIALILYTDLHAYHHIKRPPNFPSGEDVLDDEDVQAERDRIEAEGRGGGAHVTLHRLRKMYGHGASGKVAVESLSLSVGLGEFFTLLGPNGAGKTTTMLMMTGEQTPTGGEALVGGKGVYKDLLDIFPGLGMCAQQDTVWEQLTAREHLWLCCVLRGMSATDGDLAVQALIEGLGIEEWADKRVSTFSGGTKRKLCVGMALAGNPCTVLLDEPSTGLDPVSKRRMWSLLAALRAGRSTLLTTHSMAEAEALSTRVGIMGGGRLRCIGTPQHLKRRFGRGLYLQVRALEDSREAILALLGTVVSSDIEVTEQVTGEEYDTGLDREGVVTLAFSLQLTIGGGDRVPLATLFSALEKERASLGIQDYNVTQVTLEQVFLRVTHQQQQDFDTPGVQVVIEDE